MADELVHLRRQDGVATITLDSPHNRNALSARLRRELRDHLRAALDDAAVRVLVVDHTGPVFCSGMDLKESRAEGPDQQGVREVPELLELLWTSPKPVVAKVGGPARAGGIGLVSAADIAVAVEDATFAFSEVRLGLVPAVISVTVLPRVDARAAHELFLTGETFDARRAAAIGLINRAVAAEDLDAEIARCTDVLLRGAPGAQAATKRMIRRERPSMEQDFQDMLALSAKHFASEEGREGASAFAEKRPPSWAVN